MNENGVWRTIRGRRVFIKDGEDLSSAMKRSGKFDNLKREDVVKAKQELEIQRTKEQTKHFKRQENLSRTKRDKEDYHDRWSVAKEEEREAEFILKYYDNPEENHGIMSKQAGKHIASREARAREIDKINSEEDYIKVKRYPDDKNNNEYTYVKRNLEEDKFYTRKDGTKEYDPYKGTRFEKKYDSAEEALNDSNHPTRRYIDEKKAQVERFKKRKGSKKNSNNSLDWTYDINYWEDRY